jgi:chemotaxis protein methyltransferase CheR
VPSGYDVVFCRNVMMYFSPDQASALVERIWHALAPGGYLFLGHAETLRGISHDFHLRHTHGSFYYQRKDSRDERDAIHPSAPERRDAPEPVFTIANGLAWVDVIRAATDRVASLTAEPTPASTRAVQHRYDRAHVLDLLARERFAEGLAIMGDAPEATASDPETLLLHAVLLAHDGRLDRAEAVCARILEIDELDAGAHYVLALCAESSGDLERALDHDRVAIYLDPVFAMPRLHAGMLARRRADAAGARRDLEQASILLVREDASRLLMFGGGFDRSALLSLCRAELAACGGPR